MIEKIFTYKKFHLSLSSSFLSLISNMKHTKNALSDVDYWMEEQTFYKWNWNAN